MSKSILVNKKEYEELKKDKARMDFIESVVQRGKIKFLGTELNIPKPKEPVRMLLDTYRLNDKIK